MCCWYIKFQLEHSKLKTETNNVNDIYDILIEQN